MNIEDLEKIAVLREKGILTEEEFLKEKNKIMNKETSKDEVTENKKIIIPKGMKKCISCNEVISKSAKICPHCGRDERTLAQKNPAIGCLIVILSIIGLWIFITALSIILN